MVAQRPPFTPEQRADIDAWDAAHAPYGRVVDWNRPATRSDSGPKRPSPWLTEVTPADVNAWRCRNLDERWDTTEAIAQCLTWLEATFGGYSDPEGR